MTKLEEKLLELGYKEICKGLYRKDRIYFALEKNHIIDWWVDIGKVRTKNDIKMIVDNNEYYFCFVETMQKDLEVLKQCQD